MTCSPTAFNLVLVRPFVPFVIRTIPFYWRMKLIDWLPIKPLKEMRRIVKVMDETSKKIYSAKLTSLESPFVGGISNGEGDLGPRMRGKDIMTILRMIQFQSLTSYLSHISLVKANSSASQGNQLTEEELLGQMKLVHLIPPSNVSN